MRAFKMLPVVMLLGLTACRAGLTDRNGTLNDTARQYAVWMATIDGHVAREAEGLPPERFSDKAWPVWWAERVAALGKTRPDGYPALENPERYVAYIRQARDRAGLPPLPAELGRGPDQR